MSARRAHLIGWAAIIAVMVLIAVLQQIVSGGPT